MPALALFEHGWSLYGLELDREQGGNDHLESNQILVFSIEGCTLKPVRWDPTQSPAVLLLGHGYIAAMPSRPETAFDVRLMELFIHLQVTCFTTPFGFIQGLAVFHKTSQVFLLLLTAL